MHRRIAPLLLAVLVAFPVAVPATAAEPGVSPSLEVPPSPATEPTPLPEPTPSADPTTLPSASAAPSASSAAESSVAPTPDPVVDPTETTPTEPPVAPIAAPAINGRPDATGRYIVMLRGGSDTAAVIARGRKRDGLTVDRSFGHAVRGFSAKLDKQQKRDLLADPNVLAIVPDGVTEMTQTIPTGVSRVFGQLSDVAGINGSDQRVDADVAIVDTGIAAVPDLNVAGGYNCSTSDRTAWRDKNNHGTHVAGTVAALDNSFGVVGVAPGARVWAVKILNDSGYGLISWYVCGLDWILAQRDPTDASRPLFEAVNMSVTKAGSDDHNCGLTSHDALHQAICRVVAGGITVVAAAANDSHNAASNIPASYDEVITVSALADTDGKPGGLGGNRCYSWGGYDKDDTFADFSNYGGDVDLIAPGKCIMSTIPGPAYAYMSGTSMAAPTVTGAVALYKASRPKATPAEVREALRYLGNLNWKTSTDPDSTHEPLLDVSRISPLGTFALTPGATTPTVEGASTATVPLTVARSSTFFERVQLSITSVPVGWTVTMTPTSLIGWTATAARLIVSVPKGTPAGSYAIGVKGTNQGRTVLATIPITVVEDLPTAYTPYSAIQVGVTMGRTAANVRVLWTPATDPSSPIAGYELERSQDGGPWGATMELTAAQTEVVLALPYTIAYRFRVRAVDRGGNWSPWVATPDPTRVFAVDDRNAAIAHRGAWVRIASTGAYKSTESGSPVAGSRLTLAFTGRRVAVVGSTGPHRGRANIYIDGVRISTINMRSATNRARLVVFTRYLPAGGLHTISFEATGSGSYPLVVLDAFIVLK